MKFSTAFALVFISLTGVSQRHHLFNSPGQQKLLINPSFAGSNTGLQLQGTHALGYYGYASQFTQSFLSTDYLINKLGVGLSFLNYNYALGLYHEKQCDLTFNYRIAARKKSGFIPSLQATFFSRRLNTLRMPFHTDHSNTPYAFVWGAEPFNTHTKNNLSFNTGLIYYIEDRLTAGVSVFNVNQPDEGLLGAGQRKLVHKYQFCVKLFKESAVTIDPYAIANLVELSPVGFESGLYGNYKKLTFQTAVRAYNNGYYWPKPDRAVLISGVGFAAKKWRAGFSIAGSEKKTVEKAEIYVSVNFCGKQIHKGSGLIIESAQTK